VNCVAPGYTGTGMVAALPGSVLEQYVAQISVGRLGRPDEVARVVRFWPMTALPTSRVLSSRSTVDWKRDVDRSGGPRIGENPRARVTHDLAR
jgi:NAD(P)-dependent dehydrogenase (short-subunit alcohol dehydrogenase family)